MKRIYYFFFILCFIITWSSCRKDFNFTTSSGNLAFSKDTVYLDTVFTNIGSSTYNLKVYNTSNENIRIPSIALAAGATSNYRLNVDGISGNQFENVELLAKDSMYVFIETTIDIDNFTNTNEEFLHTDAIVFTSASTIQKVELVTLVKDAVFIYPNKDAQGIIETLTIENNGETIATEIQGRYLETDELTFTNQKPYVIYGYAAVPNGETLTLEAGARVHFHANSGIIVNENAAIHSNGMLSTNPELLENEVVLEGDRLEPNFADIPGQWGTIWLLNGSTNNQIEYTTIKNASVGILCEGNADATTPKLHIKNSQIYNTANFGILARNTSIAGENLVFNNAGQSTFAGTLGGKYNFTHCTFANYWNASFRQFSSVYLNNYLETEENLFLANLEEANFNNCIIYGNDTNEITLDEQTDTSVTFNFKFNHCLIRFNTSAPNLGANYDFSNTAKYEAILFNDTPNFKDTASNDLRIGENSATNNQGNTTFANQVPLDILGTNRAATPDLGAYQHIEFEE